DLLLADGSDAGFPERFAMAHAHQEECEEARIAREGLDAAPEGRVVRERPEPRHDRPLVQRDRHGETIEEPACPRQRTAPGAAFAVAVVALRVSGAGIRERDGGAYRPAAPGAARDHGWGWRSMSMAGVPARRCRSRHYRGAIVSSSSLANLPMVNAAPKSSLLMAMNTAAFRVGANAT